MGAELLFLCIDKQKEATIKRTRFTFEYLGFILKFTVSFLVQFIRGPNKVATAAEVVVVLVGSDRDYNQTSKKVCCTMCIMQSQSKNLLTNQVERAQLSKHMCVKTMLL